MHKEIPAEFCYPSSLHALFSLAMSAISYFRYLAVYPFFLPRYIGFTCGSTALYQPFLSPLFPYAFLLIRKRALRLPLIGTSECSFSFYLSYSKSFCPRLYFVILSWTTLVILAGFIKLFPFYRIMQISPLHPSLITRSTVSCSLPLASGVTSTIPSAC